MPEIIDLVPLREQLKRFLVSHERSVWHFWNDDEKVFFRTEYDRKMAEVRPRRTTSEPRRVHGLTSTVTCLESLLECPTWLNASSAGPQEDPGDLLRRFLANALGAEPGQWESDGAAWVYCRVRTLSSALRLLSDVEWNEAQRGSIQELVKWAWQSRYDDGGSFGLREATAHPSDSLKLGAEASGEQYPPNAFLTYWGLVAADLAGKLEGVPPVPHRDRQAAVDWLRENLGVQVAFHYERSAHADPQQLAYSICGLARFGDQDALGNRTSVEHELLSAGLRALFEQQRDDGTWVVGAPLFHYHSAGNAYSYTYETLAELLTLSCSRDLSTSAAEALRDELREHGVELWKAYLYAERSSQHLGPGIHGWSSGHHAHRNTAEGWATASVFRFMQGLRRLIGQWSSANAKATLGSRQPTMGLPELKERGGSWDLGSGTAGALLATTFIHPAVRAIDCDNAQGRFPNDPDAPLLGKDQAVSAVLFGPPGTGKTTMIEAVAGSLGWDFIEITPAQFLDGGVDLVSARADEIFRMVMETDRCVVLLDEIDELIQQRTGAADPLSRFFTTTMLPRLAKLWASRRVLFFANTNDITRVDSAIIRSQRFDAGLFILPAGYESKRNELAKRGYELTVPKEAIRQAILEESESSRADRPIGWLALVRFDQIDALVASLQQLGGDTQVDKKSLIVSVAEIADEMRHLDWRDAANEAGNGTNKIPTLEEVFDRVKTQFEFGRYDPRIQLYARLQSGSDIGTRDLDVSTTGSGTWVRIGRFQSPENWAHQHGGSISADGVVRFALESDAGSVSGSGT